MPIYPPRNVPIKKIEILEKKIIELQKSKQINESETRIKNKSEKVRIAKLNIIKARLSLLNSYKAEDENELKLSNIKKLEEEFAKWESMSIKDIINECCD